MSKPLSNRRQFLSAATALSVAAVGKTANAQNRTESSKNDGPTLGLIGAGWQPSTKRQGRGIAIGKQAAVHGKIKFICEVDQVAGRFANQRICNGDAKLVNDYRRVLDQSDVDAVLVATPDHWHAKIAIEAMRAGKDVYCEKPVAVTIDEGQRIRKVAKETGCVFQVGTQQRSEYQERFLTAVALVKAGRIGKVKNIRVGLGPGLKGGPYKKSQAPSTLDWDRWLGPAPMTEYIPARTHRTFRWWFEYAGGQICDWGAHHVDISQWAIDQTDSGPVHIAGTATMNQPLDAGMPTRDDMYNTPIQFSVTCTFKNGIELVIDDSRNGITFTGETGRFFVNRGTLEGTPVSRLKEEPLPSGAIEALYGGQPVSHMTNFFDCIRSRSTPISDIESHHRILSTCHLANIALRLGRPLHWDPNKELVLGDDEANRLLKRTYRKGYEIDGG